MKSAAIFWLLLGAALHAQDNHVPLEQLGKTFVTDKWSIDGESDRPALAVDTKAGQLWIVHRSSVQIVDIGTGNVIDQIKGFQQAQGLAFDDIGQFAYITDSERHVDFDGYRSKCSIKVIDRRRLQVVAEIPISVQAKNVIFDSQTGLLFVLPDSPPDGDAEAGHTYPNRQEKTTLRFSSPAAYTADRDATSILTVVDAEKQKVIGQVIFTGWLHSADSDETGTLYITVSDRNRLEAIDEALLVDTLRDTGEANPTLDWTDRPRTNHAKRDPLTQYNLAPACTEPTGLVVAGRISRLFLACGNGKLEILNPAYRQLVATFPIDPTTDTIAYDPERGLIYAPSDNGRLEIVHRHIANDSYAAVLNLPTIPQARTLAVNPDTGQLYLVTDRTAFDSNAPDVDTTRFIFHGYAGGGFQVLVVGNQ